MCLKHEEKNATVQDQLCGVFEPSLQLLGHGSHSRPPHLEFPWPQEGPPMNRF